MTAMPTLDRRGDYVSAVAGELADLAPDDRAELIEELDDHIAALLEDRPEVDLVTELGTPRAYAAELRTAAGLTGAGTSRPGLRESCGAVWGRVTAVLPWLPGFLRALRPAWWVLRGVLVAFAADLLTGFHPRSAQGVVLLLLGVAVSLWIAQHPRPTWAFRTGVVVLDVAAVIALLWVGFWSSPLGGYDDGGYDGSSYVQSSCTTADNLFAYDANGRPLTGGSALRPGRPAVRRVRRQLRAVRVRPVRRRRIATRRVPLPDRSAFRGDVPDRSTGVTSTVARCNGALGRDAEPDRNTVRDRHAVGDRSRDRTGQASVGSARSATSRPSASA